MKQVKRSVREHIQRYAGISIFSLLTVFVIGCGPTGVTKYGVPGGGMPSAADQRLADSILTVGLDNEALYTLLDTLKPISSVVSFRIGAVQKDSLLPKEAGVIALSSSDVSRLERFQRVVNTLHFGDVRLVMVPYKDIYDGQRYVEIPSSGRGGASLQMPRSICCLPPTSSTIGMTAGAVMDISSDILSTRLISLCSLDGRSIPRKCSCRGISSRYRPTLPRRDDSCMPFPKDMCRQTWTQRCIMLHLQRSRGIGASVRTI